MSVIRWLGPGRTLFAVGAAPDDRGGDELQSPLLPRVASRSEALATLADGRDDDGRAAVESYFQAGGRACSLYREPRLLDADWAGEDGGPGFRAGLAAAAEIDGVGLVVAGAASSRRLELLEAWARQWPRKLFVVCAAGAAGVTRLSHNVARVAGGAGLTGKLVAYLEAADFLLEPAPGRAGVRPPASLRAEDCRWLLEHRRFAALWRSIDEGTRWSVFDLDHELTWRRLEREVSAFLSRLERAGFFRGVCGGWRVACRPCRSRPGEGDGLELVAGPGGAIQLQVDVPSSVTSAGD